METMKKNAILVKKLKNELRLLIKKIPSSLTLTKHYAAMIGILEAALPSQTPAVLALTNRQKVL